MILIALFTNTWLKGHISTSNIMNSAEGVFDTVTSIGNDLASGNVGNIVKKEVGLFIHCTPIDSKPFFEGECIPKLAEIEKLFTDLDDSKYPHAWRGAVICFVFGLAIMILTDLFALLTVCCRQCICCSVFTICGSMQSFASILFTLGLIAYPAGWGNDYVKNQYCSGASGPFVLGENCSIGMAFWIAVAGTVCTVLASSLAIWAYQSTRSSKCEQAKDEGEHCICLV